MKGVFNMELTYRPKGVCSQLMEIETEGSKIVKVNVLGGCNGNLKAICKLLEGMDIDETISRLDGIRCGFKKTSCPDQLAQALKQIRDSNES